MDRCILGEKRSSCVQDQIEIEFSQHRTAARQVSKASADNKMVRTDIKILNNYVWIHYYLFKSLMDVFENFTVTVNRF